jgi:Tol biopolymer transport system component
VHWLITALVLFVPFAAVADGTQLTFDPAWDRAPAWSPDGRQIAFTSDRSGNWDVWVIPATGGVATQITFDPTDDGAPCWSPDGAQIVFSSERSGNWDIWAIPATGGAATQITIHPGIDRDPDWSPDGNQVAFASDRSGNSDIWAIPAAGGDATQITTDPSDEYHPAWSPDGSQIAYVGEAGISLIPATGGDPTSLDQWTFGPIAWSPDGARIAFSWLIDFPYEYAIYTIPAVGGPITRVTHLGGYVVDSSPDWSPDGSLIAFTRHFPMSGSTDIWVVDVEPPVALQHTSWGAIKARYRD